MKFFGIALYLGALLLIGVLASRRMKDLRDYFAAGKDLGFLAVAFSARATGESAWLLLGLYGRRPHVKAVVLGEVRRRRRLAIDESTLSPPGPLV